MSDFNIPNMPDISKAVENIRDTMNKINFNMPNYDAITQQSNNIMGLQEVLNKPLDFKNPMVELAEIQNDYLEKILIENQHIKEESKNISNYNKDLVSLNKQILVKVNSLNETLHFLNGAFNKNAEKSQKANQEHAALLLELITIIESKDEVKLNNFMSNVGSAVGAGLIIECIKMKFGLS
ncbi:hypothetical protein ABFP60_02115 [Clostridioides difficile]